MRKTINTKAVLEITGIKSVCTIKRYRDAGIFPEPMQYGVAKNSPLYWYEDEIKEWMETSRNTSWLSNPASQNKLAS